MKTRRALHQALIQLIIERDYDEISVMDIADVADVGRSTFYAHFTDKDDLLRSGTTHFRDLLLRDHGAAGREGDDVQLLSFSRFMTEHLKEQQQLYRALMRGRAGTIILDRFRQYICEIVRADLTRKVPHLGRGHSSELIVQFVVGAFMTVLTWWLDRGARETPQEIDKAFRELAMEGLSRLMK